MKRILTIVLLVAGCTRTPEIRDTETSVGLLNVLPHVKKVEPTTQKALRAGGGGEK